MSLLIEIPALIRVSLAFAAILLAIRRKLSLGHAFLIGGLFLSLLFTLPPVLMLKAMATAALAPRTLSLAAIVGLILILSSIMEKTGQMQRMLDAFQGLIKNPRLNLLVFPALIGLLPMPGGAVFSAPMVKQLGAHANLSGNRLSFVNYWFRHIWEYWWPLYPGILLAAVLADVNLALLVPVLAPLTLVSVAFGYGVLKRSAVAEANPATRGRIKPFFIELLPILLVIIPGLLLGLLLTKSFPNMPIAKELGLILALLAAIFQVCRKNRLPLARLIQISANRELLKMVYMIFAILIFKEILEKSGAVGLISKELVWLNIPAFAITLALPFMIGMITGITVAFVGSTFPILIPLIHSLDPGASLVPYVMLAMTCGFAGVLLSPLHLCLILSNQYFNAEMKRVYRLLWLPCAGLMGVSCVYFFGLKLF